jgi:hypothetical protein
MAMVRLGIGIEKKPGLKFILSNQCWHVEVLDIDVGINEIVRGWQKD